MRDKQIRHRDGLAMAVGLMGLSVAPRSARAQMAAPTQAAVERVLAGRSAEEAGITLRVPPIAENGNIVPMTVIVDSPMTEADHIRVFHVFADKNPTPEVATLRLTPAMGRAQVDTRIRLGQAQDVIAIAETSGGRLLIGRAEVKVTIGGCGG
jgi:sulfur-oxidizing protein SoxY